MFYIYKLTSPEGKIYVGITKQDKQYKRWQYGKGYASNQALHNDIFNFGWKNFQHEVLGTVETKAEAIQQERKYILQFESNNPDKGYNKHTNESCQPKLHNYIQCNETGEVFESMTLAAAAYGVTKQAISYAISHNKPCVGFHWSKIELTREAYQQLRLAKL